MPLVDRTSSLPRGPDEMIDLLPPPVSAGDLDAGTPTPSQKTVLVPQERASGDIVEVWGVDSFPASDPPANW